MFKYANVLVDLGGFGLTFYGLFFFSVKLTKHEDPKCTKVHFPNAKVSDLHYAYVLGFQTAEHLITHF